jgi:hypothetical protein
MAPPGDPDQDSSSKCGKAVRNRGVRAEGSGEDLPIKAIGGFFQKQQVWTGEHVHS